LEIKILRLCWNFEVYLKTITFYAGNPGFTYRFKGRFFDKTLRGFLTDKTCRFIKTHFFFNKFGHQNDNLAEKKFGQRLEK
jgi:hypothetical protein